MFEMTYLQRTDGSEYHITDYIVGYLQILSVPSQFLLVTDRYGYTVVRVNMYIMNCYYSPLCCMCQDMFYSLSAMQRGTVGTAQCRSILRVLHRRLLLCQEVPQSI